MREHLLSYEEDGGAFWCFINRAEWKEKIMAEENKKTIDEKEIIALTENSLKEAKSFPEIVKKKYLEKDGMMPQLFQQISQEKDLEKKKRLGKLVNDWKSNLTERIQDIEKKSKEQKIKRKSKEDELDIYLEGKKIPLGNLHPLTQIIQKIFDIFVPLGYQVVESPEIDSEEYSFNKLNMPPEHPARDMQDTFHFNTNLLLRPHTSNTQTRVMGNNPNQELKVISAGKVYRRDEDDATHTHQFTQIEGFVVGHNISFSHLKGTLELVLKKLFGQEHPIRFRPSYFPFVEPGVEVDAQCLPCQGQGCNVCKKTGWVEILGAGLIHPLVLRNCGYDNQIFTGFAFGLGVERLLMIQYGVEDIRHFYSNDIRFLKQFRFMN